MWTGKGWQPAQLGLDMLANNLRSLLPQRMKKDVPEAIGMGLLCGERYEPANFIGFATVHNQLRTLHSKGQSNDPVEANDGGGVISRKTGGV